MAGRDSRAFTKPSGIVARAVSRVVAVTFHDPDVKAMHRKAVAEALKELR